MPHNYILTRHGWKILALLLHGISPSSSPARERFGRALHGRQNIQPELQVEPRDVLIPLGLLALNLLLQKRIYAFLVESLPSSSRGFRVLYRLFRLTPFGAVFDVGLCLKPILRYERWDITPEIPENSSELKDLWTRLGDFLGNFARLALALAAAYRLLILTTFRGVDFTIFSAWALFASYLLNELLSSSTFRRLLHQTVARLLSPVLPGNPGPSYPRPYIGMHATAFVLACFVEIMHICWLCQYLIPRTLWMDSQRPRNYLGIYMPPELSFWPSHSIIASIFYSLNLVVFCLLMSLSAFFIIVPYYLFLAAAVAGMIALAYLLPTLAVRALGNTLVRQLIDPTTSLVHYLCIWRPEPLSPALTLAGRLEVATKIFLHVLVWSGLFFVYLSPLLGHYLFDVSRDLLKGMRTRLTAVHIDGPQGSYAVLCGTLLLVAVIVSYIMIIRFDSRTVDGREKPILSGLDESKTVSWSVDPPKRMTTVELQRLVTLAWAVSLFCILPAAYYVFYFECRTLPTSNYVPHLDCKNTSKPEWTTTWF